MKFAVSSIAFLGKPIEEIIKICSGNKWPLEFSSGIPYRGDMEKIFLETKIIRYAHNYFPAPEIPFVLNLASSNEIIRKKSIDHCIHGLSLTKKVGAPFFSAHAGFCIDPNPNELGKQLSKDFKFDKNENWKLFKLSLHEILAHASQLGLKFLIENNVIAKMNIYHDGSNPLLCCEENEIRQLFREMKNPSLGLLLDTAHWKVSANTLKFNATMSVNSIAHYISCIHHSDNEGEYDNNLPLNNNYWFLEKMEKFKDCLHVLEVKKIDPEVIMEQINLLSNQLRQKN